ncbi:MULTISPECIES: hypothetical protein [unclassified Streptomyces]|uniref:hypothetical protein n=1 Tax=unclassified Streptomyces TaxID=2593676 RepID=UPI0022B66B96|nr:MULTISPECIES: hypothetical protein [unclassified Streptomyces]MCZ7417494.1 hypothetical protein [Streptomyces sp. WMMC897]MCZ7432677.1 hypothetical protein [Streptomyces sp. WMMC1477]
MRGNQPAVRSATLRGRWPALLALIGGAQGAAFLASGPAAADPTEPPDDPGASPSPDESPDPDESNNPCDLVRGTARELCEGGGDGGGGSRTPEALESLDPLSSLANGCAEAAAWIVGKLSEAVEATADVDFTNAAFLRQYAVVFAASTILTLILWLLAVTKRAIRGVPLTTALSEAVGFLWLVVLASAFTPLVLYTLVSASDAVTDVIATGTGSQTDKFFGTFSEALRSGEDIGGGPIMLIVVSLVSVLAAGVLWLELVIRAALLYVGALLGVVVYSGLVDKNMWAHVRRWAGIMIAVILVKPVIVIVLGLAGALAADDGPNAMGAIVSGLAIILLAIFASAMIYRFVPGFGDDIVRHRNASADPASRKAVAAIATPAAMLRQGISAHSARGSGSGGGQQGGGGGGAKPANPVAGGMAAHSTRTAAPPQQRANPPAAPRTTNDRTGGDRR